jgi:hypothetical protein
MCFDKRVIAGLVVVSVAVAVFAPGALAVALPVLVLAACPLSMLLMMQAMSGPRSPEGPDGVRGSGREPMEPAASGHEVAELRAELARLRAVHAGRIDRRSDAPAAESR